MVQSDTADSPIIDERDRDVRVMVTDARAITRRGGRCEGLREAGRKRVPRNRAHSIHEVVVFVFGAQRVWYALSKVASISLFKMA